MIIYRLDILDKHDRESDFTLGFYSTKKAAQYAFGRFVKMNNKEIMIANLKHDEEWPLYEEEHRSFICEYILDDFTWDE